jgi:multicomponent Na+:H+ antiporter subunit B
MRALALLSVIFVGTMLLWATVDFPDFGDAGSAANSNRLSEGFIREAYPRTKTPNMVTTVLADYRSFDTMFETVVIFIAGIAIIAVLRSIGGGAPGRAGPAPDQPQNMITATTCRIVIPVIQLFALYVVAHGHYSPGGGFQGGLMLGASYILLALTSGLPAALRRLSESRAIVLAAVGLIIYAGFGVAAMLLGENFLDYSVLEQVMPFTDEKMARNRSALGVEIGVAFTVAAIMFAIYANLSTRGRLRDGL